MIKKILACVICLFALLSLAACNKGETGDGSVSSIKLDRSSLTLDRGDTVALYAASNPADVSAALSWHSTNTGVVTVNDGIVKAVGSGNATIVCSAPNGTYGKCSIVVNGAVCEHIAGQWIIDKEATCSTNGIKHKDCTLCGDMVEVTTIERNGEHTPGGFKTLTKQTCVTDGVTQISCLNCGTVIRTETTPATGTHTVDQDKWIIDIEASCGKNGVKHQECKDCGKIIKVERTEAVGDHIPGELRKEYIGENTCLGPVYYDLVRICTACGEECSRTTASQSTGDHSYAEWTVIRDSDCTETGLKRGVCEYCGVAKEEVINAIGHDLEFFEGVEPTCQNAGYTAYESCKRAGCTHTTKEDLPKLHHDYNMKFEGFTGKTYPTKDSEGSVTLECKFNCPEAGATAFPQIRDLPAFSSDAWTKTHIVGNITEYSYKVTDKYGVEITVTFLLDNDYNIVEGIS